MLAGFRSHGRSLCMVRLARLGDLPRDRQRFVQRQAAQGDALRERLALDQLEHERTNQRLP